MTFLNRVEELITGLVKMDQAITWTTCPHVALVDFMGFAPPDAIQMALALEKQIVRDFAPLYHVNATVSVHAPDDIPLNAWVVGLFEKADQPGALGYHDQTPHGLPLAKVFPLLDEADGSPLSVTISHEIVEMLADPLLAKAVQSPIDGRFWAYEVADAVEDDVYEIDGVKVSNFVYPAYFEPPKNTAGVKFDQMGLIQRPYEVRPGGYMQYFDRGGWHQVVNQSKARRSYRMTDHGRSCHRKRREPVIPR